MMLILQRHDPTKAAEKTEDGSEDTKNRLEETMQALLWENERLHGEIDDLRDDLGNAEVKAERGTMVT